MKRPFITVIALLILVSIAGCGGVKSNSTLSKSSSNNTESKTQAESDTVHIAYVAMSTTTPHGLINQKYTVFADELAKTGKKVKFTATRSLDNLYPLLDQDSDEPDFVYLPHSAFTTYATKTSKFGGSDKYAIVAGSMDLSDIDVVMRPEIRSVKDLAGKKVAISNLRYSDEFQLNKLLATVGLKTKSMGGNVEIVWDDIVAKTLENYEKGQYDAVVVFSSDNKALALEKVSGSNVVNINPEGLYGGQHPRVWMVAKKELIKSNPELVKEVLKAHILSGDKAKENIDELAEINREVFIGYFQEKGADISAKNPIEKFQKRWKVARITHDPNMEFVKELFDFLQQQGMLKGFEQDYFVQINPLNEALKEMGRPEVKK